MQQIGLAGQGVLDQQVLQAATTLNRCVITFNRKDFIRLHTQVLQHSGIVVCTFDRDYSALSQRIHQRLTEFSDLAGQLLRVQRPNLSA